MSLQSATITILALTLATGGAKAASDADALEAFGLLGESAINCKEPSNGRNFHVVFAVSGADVVEILKSGPAEYDVTHRVRAAKILVDHRIAMEIEGYTKRFGKVIIVKSGKIWHTDSSEVDGRMLIKDGRVVSRGTDIQRFERCDDH